MEKVIKTKQQPLVAFQKAKTSQTKQREKKIETNEETKEQQKVDPKEQIKIKCNKISAKQKAGKKFSYFTYNKLVGEADGGKELSPEQFAIILQKYHDSWTNRIYVHFARTDIQKECIRVKPSCFCFCGHTFKSHEWWDSENKIVKCRVPNCQCPRYRYLHHQGSWFLQCKCKHTAVLHNKDGAPGPCSNCDCMGFDSTFACQCGGLFNVHDTIVTTQEQRRDMGISVDPDIVKDRLQHKKKEGCGKCMGCKNRMPCYEKNKK